MLKPGRIVGIVAVTLALVSVATAQCPGYNPGNNSNLACAIATSAPSQSKSPGLSTTVGTTMATQLAQLPIATAASGAGLVFDPSIGTWKVAEDVGPILTQRGDTIGRHAKFVSFSYQRFRFDDIDGIDLKHLNIVNNDCVTTCGVGNIYALSDMRVDFRVDQFVALGTVGVTDRVDLSVAVPFSYVSLTAQRRAGNAANNTGSLIYQDFGTSATIQNLDANYYPGSASGLGDIIVGVKANVFRSKSEKTAIAIGNQFRLPSGDALNYLGSGAWGLRPYVVLSHRGRVTPNVTLAYQWNSVSVLNQDSTGKHLPLPSSLLYSGGADVRITGRLSASGEFLGQYIINGPRLGITTTGPSSTPITSAYKYNGSYAMDNVAVGLKANPFKGLFVSADVMFKLDNAGLRANVVPLVGIAYRF